MGTMCTHGRFLHPEDIMPVVLLQHVDMTSIGTEVVCGDDQIEVRVLLAQLDDQTLGHLPLTIVFLGAILLHNGLGHQGHHFAPVGMDEGSAQHLVAIGEGAAGRQRRA